MQNVLTRRRVLILGGVGAGAAAMMLNVGAAQADGPVMTPAEAHAAAAAGDILLVDIRRPDEWAATGIGEHGVGIDMRAEDFVAQVQAARRGDQPIAVICARGVRSARTTKRLTQAGIGTIIDVPEGMLGSRAGPGWLGRGLPVVQP
ncbi:rhodanese-like domain-containing protein [Pseudooctadecabacter sp.]|uniref:rhodanese-like domain-containing protein n=1 Tax=Pseudooctadecabacter sp. TaxID=1966338 RepID=UPI0035C8641F